MKFDSYHPVINLIYFTAAIVCIWSFQHPVYLAVSYTATFIYSVKLNGRKALVFDLCLIPCIFIYGWIYSSYNHFGITELWTNSIGNSMTLESMVYGVVTGAAAASFIMLMSCFFRIFSSDKVIYLFGRISPKLSLFISIALRSVYVIKAKAKMIDTARKGLGRGHSQGKIIRRMRNSVRIVSILITNVMENFVEEASAMKSRGYSLRGRTAFSIYRFDNRDRSLVVVFFTLLVMLAAAFMLDQTFIYYDPQIVMNRITPVSYIFYISYGVFLLLPAGLQVVSEHIFAKTSASK